MALFKQEAASPYPACVAAEADLAWPNIDEEATLIQNQILWWDVISKELEFKLTQRDANMKKAYESKQPTDLVDVRF